MCQCRSVSLDCSYIWTQVRILNIFYYYPQSIILPNVSGAWELLSISILAYWDLNPVRVVRVMRATTLMAMILRILLWAVSSKPSLQQWNWSSYHLYSFHRWYVLVAVFAPNIWNIKARAVVRALISNSLLRDCLRKVNVQLSLCQLHERMGGYSKWMHWHQGAEFYFFSNTAAYASAYIQHRGEVRLGIA